MPLQTLRELEEFRAHRKIVANRVYWILMVFTVLFCFWQMGIAGRMTKQRNAFRMRSQFWDWVVHHTDIGIVVVNGNTGRIDGWNGAAAKITGYTAKEVNGTSIWELMPADYMGDHEKYIGNATVRQQLAFNTIRVRCWLKAKNKPENRVFVEIAVHGVPASRNDVTSPKDFKFMVLITEPNRLLELPEQPPPEDNSPARLVPVDPPVPYRDVQPLPPRLPELPSTPAPSQPERKSVSPSSP